MPRMKRIDQLVIGDMVDLQNDPFADNGNHPEFEFEYATVCEMERETPSCMMVCFDSIACGFPPAHMVTLAD